MFTNITELSDFIDDNINTNGTNSITGANLNTGLQGIIQFLGAGNSIYTGSFLGTVNVGGSTDIPHGLSTTPKVAMIVATDNLTGQYLALSYYLTYDSTNITVNGVSAPFPIGITDLSVDWIAII